MRKLTRTYCVLCMVVLCCAVVCSPSQSGAGNEVPVGVAPDYTITLPPQGWSSDERDALSDYQWPTAQGVIFVGPKTMSFLKTLPPDIIFFTSKGHPLKRLADICGGDEFAAWVSKADVVDVLHLKYIICGSQLSLRMIGNGNWEGLFSETGPDPKLKLFVTSSSAYGAEAIESSGGGMKVRFMEQSATASTVAPAAVNTTAGQTAIIDAAKTDDLEKVQALLKNNPDLAFSKDGNGATPLHLAAARGHKDVAELLLAHGADVSAKNNVGDTPLELAAAKDHADVVELLLANNADVNAKNNYGQTPLIWAAINGHRDMAELLLAHGADVNAKDNHGQTPLRFAAAFGYKDVAELLLDNKANVNASGVDGVTPLHVAAMNGHRDVAELLLAHGADVSAKNNVGNTPLELAAGKDHADVVELLLANNADVNAKDNQGQTPLEWAAANGYEDVAELLLAKNADVNAKDNRGRTPLHLAIDNGHKDMAKLLRQHGGKK